MVKQRFIILPDSIQKTVRMQDFVHWLLCRGVGCMQRMISFAVWDDRELKEMQEYLIEKQTVEHILGIDWKNEEEKRQKEQEQQAQNHTRW